MQQQARGITRPQRRRGVHRQWGQRVDRPLAACLADAGDEVLIPSPDYPLWSAAVTLNGGKAVYYPCKPENEFVPDPQELAKLITRKTRANRGDQSEQSDGRGVSRAPYAKRSLNSPRPTKLVVFSDEIYDQMTYDGVESIPMATAWCATRCVARCPAFP